MKPDAWKLDLGARLEADGVRFRVWSPQAERLDVVIFENNQPAARHALSRGEDGYWLATIPGLGAGTRYAFSVDGGDPRPDPASRAQPEGVHGPSEVIDPAFAWSDNNWRGIALADLVVYELHVGTATPAGTFEALIPKLQYFRDLGITALEIMPVHNFPGDRNWGYDGVNLYAPARAYGGAQGFKRLIDAAHAHGLAVILDVVYNHFGPDGNYLRVFSPAYFTDQHHTPWGDALNLDQQHSRPVRDFLINNALYWAHEYHIDGLRLDATHALIDDSAPYILQELTATIRESLPPDRQFVITAEDERNDARLGQPITAGGYGLDAIWADDFHHQARIALTGEQGGYYADYTGAMPDLATTIRDGWFYQGQVSTAQNHARGTSPLALEYPQFVYCIQNHDQIGNRPLGDRLNHAVDPAAYRALSALLVLLPHTPLLFQGQEWAASTPFQFFTDHNPELGKLVTEGRRREFAFFMTETHLEVPDPQDVATFERSKLNWDELDQPPHAGVLALYRDALALRRTQSALQRRDRDALGVAVLDEHALLIRRNALTIVVNLGSSAVATIPQASATPLLDTNAARYGGTQPTTIAQNRSGGVDVQLHAPGVVVL